MIMILPNAVTCLLCGTNLSSSLRSEEAKFSRYLKLLKLFEGGVEGC